MTLAHHRGGSGEPLALLHGIGSQWQMWRPVLGLLEAEREVVALDLPGFGESAPLPADVAPSPARIARAVAEFLDEVGWEAPHVAGNSLGGWVGLELAKLGRARSVCALSPAGFWSRAEVAYSRASLRSARLAARGLAGAPWAVAGPVRRRLAFAQLVVHGDRLAPDEATGALRNLAASPGWEATLDAISGEHFRGGGEVAAPVTIAWSEKDRLLLPRQAERARTALPRARHVVLPGCGHVPTWDGPELVARAVLTSG